MSCGWLFCGIAGCSLASRDGQMPMQPWQRFDSAYAWDCIFFRRFMFQTP